MSEPLEAAQQFDLPGRPVAAAPEPRGHIHDTWVVTCTGSADRPARVVLQRLDPDVFPDLAALMGNVSRVSEHLRLKAQAPLRPPALLRARDGLPWWVDSAGRWWRAWEYVEGTRVAGTVASPAEAEQAARAFGRFVADLADLPGPPLTETIPRFHDLDRRVASLRAARDTDGCGRAGPTSAEVEQAIRLAERVATGLAGTLDRLPVRVVHNDAKIDNVLFDARSGEAVCVIDLDTTMPGRVPADFGELVRSGATHAAEDEPDLERIDLDLDLFAALARGYASGTGSLLTAEERDLLPLGGPWLTLENGVRFLTDHLAGDVYYRIHRPAQNLDRARAQLRLAALMLDRLDDLADITRAATTTEGRR